MLKDSKTVEPAPADATEDVDELNRRAEQRAMQKWSRLEAVLSRRLVAHERVLIGWEPRCLAWSVLVPEISLALLTNPGQLCIVLAQKKISSLLVGRKLP